MKLLIRAMLDCTAYTPVHNFRKCWCSASAMALLSDASAGIPFIIKLVVDLHQLQCWSAARRATALNCANIRGCWPDICSADRQFGDDYLTPTSLRKWSSIFAAT